MPLIVTANGNINDSPLTTRERNILELVAKGLQHKEIAEKLSITSYTVKKHIKNAYKKLGVHNKLDALRQSGLW